MGKKGSSASNCLAGGNNGLKTIGSNLRSAISGGNVKMIDCLVSNLCKEERESFLDSEGVGFITFYFE